jgi:nucleotide-binding universal stress UspA family protein
MWIMKILLTTDFTEASGHATKYIKSLVQNWDTEEVSYVLVHGYKPLVPYTNVPSMPVIKNKDLEEKLIGKFKRQYALLKKDTNIIAGYSERGSLPAVINDIVEKESPDLIVMGTREKDAFERMTIGTNTLEVALNTSVPVLAVPKEASIDKINAITFATHMKQGKNQSAGIDFLKSWVILNKAHLQILHVSKEGTEEGLKKQMEDSELHRILARIDHQHYPVTNTDVFEGIMSFTNQTKPDMLVAMPDERSFLDRIFHNTTTDKMAYHLRIPLLILG